MLVKSLQTAKNLLSVGSLPFWRAGVHGIGVDLGSVCSKVVILKKQEQQWMLLDWVIEEVQPSRHTDSDRSDGIIHPQTADSLPQNIKRLLKKNDCVDASLGITVGGPRIIIKMLSLPPMTEEDIREHVKWELDRYISPEMGELLWDVHTCLHPFEPQSSQQQVLLVGAKRDYIEATTLRFRDQGLEIGFVDIDVLALVNMVTFNYGQEETWLISHLGPSGILFLAMQGGELIWRHEVAFGVEWYGDLVDQLLVKQLISSHDQGVGDSEQALLEPFLDEVNSHVHDAIQKFSQTSYPGSLGGMFLSGGYSVVGGIPSRLAQVLGLPVSFVDPFKKILVPPAMAENPTFLKSAPMLGVAVGAAIRGDMRK